MTANHAHFDRLCALEASRQLTSTELAELNEHCDCCATCSELLADMTQISAQLFSAHALKQPKMQMPQNMLERFVARANSEGISLSPPAASTDGFGVGLAATLVLALLLISATLHVGLVTKSAGRRGEAAVAGLSTFRGERSGVPKAPAKASSLEARRPTATNQRNAGPRRQRTMLAASLGPAHEKQIETNSAGPETAQFDMAIYSRNRTLFSRPFLSEINLNQIMQSSSADYRVPRLNIVGPSEYAREDAPRLLAESDYLTVAPWNFQSNFTPEPPDAQTLRRDFDPDARGAMLSSDLRRRPPALQFARESNQ